MTLGDAQRQFTPMVARLILWAYDNGYQLTFGEAYRSDEQAEIHALGFNKRSRAAFVLRPEFPELASKIENNSGNGVRNSLHCDRLAVDFNLFRDGVLLTKTEDFKPLGEIWETMGGTWGGRFGDAPHFSLAFGGRK